MENLPQILAKLRADRGLSLRQLSKFVGVSHNNLRLYEHGEVMPSLDVAKRIAHFYDVPIAYLFTGEDLVSEFHDAELRALFAKVDRMDLAERKLIKRFIKNVIRNREERLDLEDQAGKRKL